MKVVAAPGSQDMIEAIAHPIVHEIVTIMLSHIKDQIFFKMVALFLKDHERNTTPSFMEKLGALGRYGQNRPNGEGLFISPPYVGDLVTELEELYAQAQSKINFQRGAIVELLAFSLVKPRCRANECFGNYRFVYERNPRSTDQIDVAVFSKSKQRIEAYTCKIKPDSIQSEDCNNLIDLAKEAAEQDYDIRTGAISFDNSQKIEQRLRRFPGTEEIKAYGINNITKLANDPFIL
jgi:hypothetical protein